MTDISNSPHTDEIADAIAILRSLITTTRDRHQGIAIVKRTAANKDRLYSAAEFATVAEQTQTTLQCAADVLDTIDQYSGMQQYRIQRDLAREREWYLTNEGIDLAAHQAHRSGVQNSLR